MMSRRGHLDPGQGTPVTVTASGLGEVLVEEFPYGLGPPTGILALRYPATSAVTDFPESRNDFVHQIYVSPDGVLAANRAGVPAYAGPGSALWIRRGAVAEVTALDLQTVVRLCVRQAPDELTRHAATVLRMTDAGQRAVRQLVTPGTDEATGLEARATLLRDLRTAPPDPVGHGTTRRGPARTVAGALAADPADSTGLAGWAERLHVSTKTLQRDFERDLGTSFSAWRTRTRLQASLAMLGRWSVTESAHRVGYASASAYIAAFTREFGLPPGQYVEQLASARAS